MWTVRAPCPHHDAPGAGDHFHLRHDHLSLEVGSDSLGCTTHVIPGSISVTYVGPVYTPPTLPSAPRSTTSITPSTLRPERWLFSCLPSLTRAPHAPPCITSRGVDLPTPPPPGGMRRRRPPGPCASLPVIRLSGIFTDPRHLVGPGGIRPRRERDSRRRRLPARMPGPLPHPASPARERRGRRPPRSNTGGSKPKSAPASTLPVGAVASSGISRSPVGPISFCVGGVCRVYTRVRRSVGVEPQGVALRDLSSACLISFRPSAPSDCVVCEPMASMSKDWLRLRRRRRRPNVGRIAVMRTRVPDTPTSRRSYRSSATKDPDGEDSRLGFWC